MGADEAYLTRETAQQLDLLRQRRALWKGIEPIAPAGRVVVVLDDGMATGSTMAVALQAVRAQHPQKLVCAAPVASREAVERVQGRADEVVCLATPEPFGAVGRFFGVFEQVSDADALACLRAARGSGPPPRQE